MDDKQLRKYAEKRVHMKQGFYYHLLVYVIVNLFIIITRLSSEALNWTFIYPALPWGIGLILQWFFTFYSKNPLTFENKVQKEIENYNKRKKQ